MEDDQKPIKTFKRYRNIAALFLLLWPFSWFSVFLLDDPTVKGYADILRHYVFYSSIAYPLFFIASWLLGKVALRTKSITLIRLTGIIPFLSGLPWLVCWLVVALCLAGMESSLKKAGWFDPKPSEVFLDDTSRALAESAKKGDAKSIKKLCLKETDANQAGQGGVTPLFFAMKNLEGFTALLECGANPNVILSNGDSVMKRALLSDDENFLRKSVEHNGDPNLKYQGMVTKEPLIFLAASLGRLKIDLLMSLGADINAKNSSDYTVLQNLIVHANFEMALYILKYNPDLSVKNKRGLTLQNMIEKKMKVLDKTHVKFRRAQALLKKVKTKNP